MDLILVLILLFEIPIFAVALRRSGFMLFPHGMLVYLMGAQIMMWAVARKYVDYAFVHLYTRYAWLNQYPKVALACGALFLAYVFCTPRSRVSVARLLRSVRVRDGVLWGIIIFLWLRLLINLAVINWSVAWANTTYLEMTGLTGLAFQNGFFQVVHFSQKIAGVLATLCLVYAFNRGKFAQVVLIFPLFIWHFSFELAAHSRYAAAYLLLGAMIALILKGRPSISQLCAGVLGIITLVSTLGGRNLQQQGFSSIPEFFNNFALRADSQALGSLANIFEGAFVSSEIFAREFAFSDRYALLSFSPLVSAIDGFEAIRRQEEIRINIYVPSGAINEVFSFDLIYIIIYFATQLMAGFLSARLLSRYPGVVALLLNGLVFMACYAQFAYSTRTVYRIFLFSLIAAIFLLRRGKKQRKRERALVMRREHKRQL